MTDHAQESSLTREEAEQRASLISVTRYDIAVDMTGLLEGDLWESTSTITFTCAEPGASTFVDCLFDVEHAVLNGRELDVSTVAGGRLSLEDLAEHNVLVVAGGQTNTSASAGILRTVDESDKLVYVWTSFEPDDARRLWACFDQPDLKAPHGLTVTAPESWVVTSNSAPDDVSATENGDRVWSFADTPPLSTYVAVVNGGPFHEIRSQRDGYDLGLYCRQSLARYLERDAEELFTLTQQGLAFYGERFGIAFPQERYDQVFVPNMGGAMENWGCVTWSDSSVYRSTPTYVDRGLRAMVLLHEMAHMWFGDLVTMRWWDDLWLNEAFASWAATWSAARATEFRDAEAGYLVQQKMMGYAQDMSPATHPIRAEVSSVAHAMGNFDAITYVKGQAVLAQLAAYVGEEEFVAGLRAYFARHQWGNTVLDDLISAVAEASGRDLSGWTTAWLDRAGTDTLSLADGTLTATSPDEHAPRPHRFSVAGFRDDADFTPVGLAVVEVAQGQASVDLPPADAHVLNAGDETFAASRVPEPELAILRRRVAEIDDATARAAVVTTAYDMMLRGELDAGPTLDCLLAALATESAPELVEPLLDFSRGVAELWTPAADVPAAVARVADAAAARSEDPDVRLVALQTLAATATAPAHLQLLADASQEDHDLAWRLLSRRAELGDHDDDAVRRLKEVDPDPESWARALEVTGALDDAAAKEEVWQAIMVDRRVPAGNVYAIAPRFWRPLQREVLRPYADRFLDTLQGLSGGALLTLGPLVRGMVPFAVADEAWLEDASQIASSADTHPAIAQNLTFTLDRVRRQLAARAG